MIDQKNRAVLTGDIVASQRLNPGELDRVRLCIQQSCEQISSWSLHLAPYPVEFSRGDSWQFLLSDPALALRASLFIRSALLFHCGVDTRVAVAIDQLSSLADTLALSDGPAFVRSGRALDKMTKARVLVLIPAAQPLAPWVALVSQLCDTLVGTWTRRQAELVHAFLAPHPPTQSAIAVKLKPPVSKQAVGKGLRAAHWDVLAEVLEVFEASEWSSAEFVDNDNQ